MSVDIFKRQTVYYGAAACSPTRLQEGIRRLGPIFFQYYGQAECPMAITSPRRTPRACSRAASRAASASSSPYVTVRPG